MFFSAALRGLLLASVAAFFWGVLPVALKQLLTQVDVLTLVWARFSVTVLWLWATFLLRAERPGALSGSFRPFSSPRVLFLFLLAVAGLAGNVLFYNFSLRYLTASACQLTAQTGPLFLLLAGVLVLREPMRRTQLAGIPLLLLGFLCFFNENLAELASFQGDLTTGLLLCLAGTSSWALFGLVQKILLRDIPPEPLFRLTCTAIAAVLLPLSAPANLLVLSGPLDLVCLAFCCLSTLAAFGSFTRALACWKAACVGAVISLTPLITLLTAQVCHLADPRTFPADLPNALGLAGALTAVTGAWLIALGPAPAGRGKA